MSFYLKLILTISTIISHTSCSFMYGPHFPNGVEAVDYIYGPNGTWKGFSPLNYIWNYYPQYATENHPYNFDALLAAANGSAFFTARDANGYLLCDSDHDLELNPEYCGGNPEAFHEHNGIKANGIRGGTPFTQFWLDDNWLARYMSQTYGRKEPRGLVDQSGFLRWRVLCGDTTNWVPYESQHFDTIALDGLFYLARNNVSKSLELWQSSLKLSEAVWNETSKVHEYPGVHENYHLGLWKIHTEMLLGHPAIRGGVHSELLQHSVSLSSTIIKNQEIDVNSRARIGWLSNIGSDTALINTESVSCCVLGLGANSKYVFQFEPKRDPRKRNLFTIDLSEDKMETEGPRFPLQGGRHTIQFVLRPTKPNPDPNEGLAVLKIVSYSKDGIKLDVLKTRELTESDFQGSKTEWKKFSLDVILQLRDAANVEPIFYDFVLDFGSVIGPHLDLAYVIVK